MEYSKEIEIMKKKNIIILILLILVLIVIIETIIIIRNSIKAKGIEDYTEQ